MTSAELVKELRARTGAGIMECKRALQESGDDIEQAIEFLRKQGTVKAAKKSGRSTKEGRVDLAVEPEGKRAAIIEVNCETDFVARNDDFQQYVAQLAQHAVQHQNADLQAFFATELEPGKTVADSLNGLISVVGENMEIARLAVLTRDDPREKIGTYMHAGNQIGVLLKVVGENVNDTAIRDVAMHIAAMNPSFVRESDVPAEVAEKEKEVLRSSPDMADKPAEVVEKMLVGRFRKFLSQVCLADQIFIKDPQGKQTVADYLKSLDPDAKIISFVRYQVGERAPA